MRFLFTILIFIFSKAIGQTRMYFPLSEAAAVNPSFHAHWTYNSEAVRRKLANTKGSSTITVGSQIGPWSSQQALDRQYVSTRMNAGITFTSGSTTVSSALMVREYAGTDNVTNSFIYIRIVSDDGATVRATLLTSSGNSSAEFINNATHRNRPLCNSVAVSSSYTTVLGDRIVVEIGYREDIGGGTTPEASAKWGENATDLPANNETQTTDGAGWIEFSNTITFAGEAGPTRRVTIIQ